MNFLRQLDIISPELLDFPITVIGCGGIGTPCAVGLAKMGISRMNLWDPDSVEDHNLPNQFVPLASIGHPKVEVLAEVLRQFAVCEPTAVQRAATGEEAQGVCIVAVDTMKARQAIWRGIRQNPAVPLLIDGRMGAEVGLIYSVYPMEPKDVAFYESSLHADEEALELPCTARAVIYNTLFMAGLIANQVKKYALGEGLSREIIFDLKNLQLLTSEVAQTRAGLLSQAIDYRAQERRRHGV
jgi:hypothetical protein